jgi:hypothetical protein
MILNKKDLSGLLRPTQPVEILGNEVSYIKPALIFVGNILRFYKSSLAPMLFSKEELSTLSDNDILSTCVERATGQTDEADVQRLVGQMFFCEALHTEIIPLMRISFPELDPLLVTDICFNLMLEIIVQDIFNLIDTPATT